jgi:hypothetical protein
VLQVITEKGKSCNVSDISRVNRIVTERMVKGEGSCLSYRIFWDGYDDFITERHVIKYFFIKVNSLFNVLFYTFC